MTDDPIVAEVRRARETLFDECGGDLDKLLDRFRAAEAKDKARLVSFDSLQRPNDLRAASQAKS